MKPAKDDSSADCPITGQSPQTDIYSERTNKYYAKQIQVRKSEMWFVIA